VRAMERPTGLPMVLILESRSHLDLGDLPNLLAAELGVMTVRLERAIRSLDGVARVHVNRWGDGSAHLHLWFLARPFGYLQLRGSFLSLWDDILPPIAEDTWRENLAMIAAWLAEFGGRPLAEPPRIDWQAPASVAAVQAAQSAADQAERDAANQAAQNAADQVTQSPTDQSTQGFADQSTQDTQGRATHGIQGQAGHGTQGQAGHSTQDQAAHGATGQAPQRAGDSTAPDAATQASPAAATAGVAADVDEITPPQPLILPSDPAAASPVAAERTANPTG
jgi:hypothetical protein